MAYVVLSKFTARDDIANLLCNTRVKSTGQCSWRLCTVVNNWIQVILMCGSHWQLNIQPATHTHTMHAHHSQHVTVGWLVGVEFLMPHSTQYRSFWRRSSQPITWLILTNKTVQENTDKKLNTNQKSKQPKIQQTKRPWFSCLLQHSARKRGGLILQWSRSPHGAQHITVTGPPHMHTCKTVVSYSVTGDQLRTIYATTESTFI